jgi:hypothetical protein
MFSGCELFNNGCAYMSFSKTPLKMVLPKVENASNMFYECKNLNVPIEFTELNELTTTENMFSGCKLFNNGGKSLTWKLPKLKNASKMFYGCLNLNVPIEFTELNELTTTEHMFTSCVKFNNGRQSLNWKLPKLENASYMFYGCLNLNVPIKFTELKALTNTEYMFSDCKLFNNGGQSLNWKLPKLVKSKCMFYGCLNLNVPIEFTELNELTTTEYMFSDCKLFNNGGKSLTWKLPKLEKSKCMFRYCKKMNVIINGNVFNNECT